MGNHPRTVISELCRRYHAYSGTRRLSRPRTTPRVSSERFEVRWHPPSSGCRSRERFIRCEPLCRGQVCPRGSGYGLAKRGRVRSWRIATGPWTGPHSAVLVLLGSLGLARARVTVLVNDIGDSVPWSAMPLRLAATTDDELTTQWFP